MGRFAPALATTASPLPPLSVASGLGRGGGGGIRGFDKDDDGGPGGGGGRFAPFREGGGGGGGPFGGRGGGIVVAVAMKARGLSCVDGKIVAFLLARPKRA